MDAHQPDEDIAPLEVAAWEDGGRCLVRSGGLTLEVAAFAGQRLIQAAPADLVRRRKHPDKVVTYIIDRKGIIRWAFVDADYRKRAEPADIVAFLRARALAEGPDADG